MKPFSKLLLLIVVVSISMPAVIFAQTSGRSIVIPNDNQRGVFRYHTPFRHITYRYGDGISDNRVATVDRRYDFRQAVAPDRLSALQFIAGPNLGGQFLTNVLPGLVGVPGASSQASSQAKSQAESEAAPLDLSQVDALLGQIGTDREYRAKATASLDASKQGLLDLMEKFGVEDPVKKRQGASSGDGNLPGGPVAPGDVKVKSVSDIQN